jgi:hypothetical protein
VATLRWICIVGPSLAQWSCKSPTLIRFRSMRLFRRKYLPSESRIHEPRTDFGLYSSDLASPGRSSMTAVPLGPQKESQKHSLKAYVLFASKSARSLTPCLSIRWIAREKPVHRGESNSKHVGDVEYGYRSVQLCWLAQRLGTALDTLAIRVQDGGLEGTLTGDNITGRRLHLQLHLRDQSSERDGMPGLCLTPGAM